MFTSLFLLFLCLFGCVIRIQAERDVNECLRPNNGGCSIDANCINTYGSFRCVCDQGFGGDGFTCRDMDECIIDQSLCSNGQCQNYPGGFWCECDQGYRPTDNTRDCQDIDECMESPDICQGGQCRNLPGSYSCTCAEGWILDPSQKSCVDVDECLLFRNLCGDGDCVNTPGSFTCSCESGYSVKTGSGQPGCTDINECLVDPRICEFTCVNTEGSYRCQCPRGLYQAVPYICEDVNECLREPNGGCDSNARCINTHGSFRCFCAEGFKGNGFHCQDEDECDQNENLCDNGRCVNIPGDYWCECDVGYSTADNHKHCQVSEVTIPHILEHPQDKVIAQYDKAILNCKAEGEPQPSITWYKDGQLLQTVSQNSHYRILPTGQLFILRDLRTKVDSRLHNGVYYCNATNPLTKVSVISKTATLIFKSDCSSPLGMQSGAIRDEWITASSTYDRASVAPYYGRLHHENLGGAWCPLHQIDTNTYEWLQIDLQTRHSITVVETQGRFGAGQGNEFAEAYTLEYQREEGEPWIKYIDRHNTSVFRGNRNTYGVRQNILDPAIVAEKIRIVPYSTYPRTVCMRVGLKGCQWKICNCDSAGSYSNLCDFHNGQCPCRHSGITGKRCHHCIPGHYNFPKCYPDDCDGPLGMESGDIKDEWITASSSFDVENAAAHHGRLGTEINGGAWCPKNQIDATVQEWLQIDLQTLHRITGVESQGRFGNGQGQEFANEFTVEYQRMEDGPWIKYTDRYNDRVFPENRDTFTAVENTLHPMIIARKIRIVPYSLRPRTVCMRVELKGCLWKQGVLAYSMPQGERKSSRLNLRDFTYDGNQVEEYLSGGLGQLVDGEKGQSNLHYKRTGHRGYEWVGWQRNTPVELVFEFDTIRNFTEVSIHANNMFSKGVRIFREAKIFFSITKDNYQQDPIVFLYLRDTLIEYARMVRIPISNNVGKFIKIQLFFDAKWMLISEVEFKSEIIEDISIFKKPVHDFKCIQKWMCQAACSNRHLHSCLCGYLAKHGSHYQQHPQFWPWMMAHCFNVSTVLN